MCLSVFGSRVCVGQYLAVVSFVLCMCVAVTDSYECLHMRVSVCCGISCECISVCLFQKQSLVFGVSVSVNVCQCVRVCWCQWVSV